MLCFLNSHLCYIIIMKKVCHKVTNKGLTKRGKLKYEVFL